MTQMGRALELPVANPTLKSHPRLSFHRGDYSYTVETQNGQTIYTVTDGTHTISLPVLWSFGAANQTWVLERDGRLYESLVSYYTAIDGLDITTGDEKLTPHTLDDAVGREQAPLDAATCFGCHTTNAVENGKLNLAAMHPGITCEHCHQGSQEHFADILKGKEDTIPVELGKLSSEDMSTFCGNCHRTWEMVVRSHWRGEANVRFQPYRIANSRCFDGADPRISCVACHDPHQSLVTDESLYDAKCLACHAAPLRPVATALRPLGSIAASTAPNPKPCPVAKSGCVSCHMPKVNMLGGHLTFTDHEIRIVKAGEPYPN